MKMFRWLLVSACVAATTALTVEDSSTVDLSTGSTGLKDLGQELVAEQEQNDAIHELADEKAQLSSVADADGDAIAKQEQNDAFIELADEKAPLSVADADGDAERPTAVAQHGELAAHVAAQQRSHTALRGAQEHSTVRAEEVAASDDDGLNGSTPLVYENQQLHKMLAMTNAYEQQLETRLKKVPLLQHNVASEQERGRTLEMQLHNATRSATQYKHELDQAKQHLGSLQRENSDLSGALHNMTAARQVLEVELVKNSHRRDELEVALGKAKTALSNSGGTRNAFKKLRQSLKQADELTVEEKGHSKSEKAATRNALLKLAQFQQDLNSTDRKLAGEVAQADQLKKMSTSLAEQLQAEQAAVSRGAVRFQRLSTASHKVAKEVAFLKRHIADGDHANKHAQEGAAETQHTLAKRDAEVKQLKGLVPSLQDKVAADERELKQAALETQKAYEARDEAKRMLDEAKRKIVHLEQQYASVVQDLDGKGGTTTATNTAPDTAPEIAVEASPSPPNLGDVASLTAADEDSVKSDQKTNQSSGISPEESEDESEKEAVMPAGEFEPSEQ